MKKIVFNTALFNFGYTAYSLIELAYRKRTHYSMGIAGGICFVSLYNIFKKIKKVPTIKKCLIGSATITFVEFVFGIIFNKILKQNVWDYSHLKFNILGQICPIFSVLWALLTLPIIFLCNKLKKIENKI